MSKLAELRAKYPQYNDMSDEQFLGAFHRKYYADMPLDDFAKRVGYGQSDPLSGMSTFDKVAAGAGKSVMDTVQGVKQLFGAANDQDVAERRAMDAPLMDTTAGTIGNIAGQGLQMAIPIPAGAAVKATSWAGKAAPYVGAATRAGVFGASQPVANGESRAVRASESAALGAVGQGIASATGAVARGAASRLDPYTQKLAAKAEAAGIRLGVPALSENPLVRTVASQMERLPFSGAGKRFRGNQEAFNAAVGKEIGLDGAKKITPEVFAGAKNRIGDEFNRLSAKNDLMLDTGTIANIRGIVDEASRLGGKEMGDIARNWSNDLISRVDANGKIPGAAYKSFDSKIGKVMGSAGGERAYYLGQLRDVVREAMDASISAGDRAAWQTARKQYAALKTIEPLVAKSSNGDIPPSLLMGRMTADNAGKVRMATGKGGSLGELAQVGQRFMKDAPNSGTADRALVNTLIGGGLYGAQSQGWIDPSTALGVGGLLMANRAGLKAMSSKALTRGEGKALKGIARLLEASPKALPAAASGTTPAWLVSGGRPATPDDIARDEEIVRRFRQSR